MILGQYQNKHDHSILEVYQEVIKKQIIWRARWIKSETKQGEFELTENFNKFETFKLINQNDNKRSTQISHILFNV